MRKTTQIIETIVLPILLLASSFGALAAMPEEIACSIDSNIGLDRSSQPRLLNGNLTLSTNTRSDYKNQLWAMIKSDKGEDVMTQLPTSDVYVTIKADAIFSINDADGRKVEIPSIEVTVIDANVPQTKGARYLNNRVYSVQVDPNTGFGILRISENLEGNATKKKILEIRCIDAKLQNTTPARAVVEGLTPPVFKPELPSFPGITLPKP